MAKGYYRGVMSNPNLILKQNKYSNTSEFITSNAQERDQ